MDVFQRLVHGPDRPKRPFDRKRVTQLVYSYLPGQCNSVVHLTLSTRLLRLRATPYEANESSHRLPTSLRFRRPVPCFSLTRTAHDAIVGTSTDTLAPLQTGCELQPCPPRGPVVTFAAASPASSRDTPFFSNQPPLRQFNPMTATQFQLAGFCAPRYSSAQVKAQAKSTTLTPLIANRFDW